ncbi:MAG: N-acetyltransferase [Aquabacterium sp.]|uniref:GNAT family N-acetyltransferase n=1 Tax=Aquabacterium sp. TaxID=1872578 RepID=UPI001B4F689F|nr:GNAT family N-acetyltransferase [Aquabacterium sp.]MBP7131429.1 N-acetyltransferase [Aquabacterium sp.]MBP9062638.1 N-acetyltransferase [Aquabacterium sp.]
MNTSPPPLTIIHNPAHTRFEVIVDGLRCDADYQLIDGVMHLTHTIVPKALEGRGIAAQLVTAALTWARAQQLQVNPVCSYVVAYIRRHPEWQDLLASAP